MIRAMSRSPLLWLAISLLIIALMAAAAPAERTLGASVRVVYLHGAWVWGALIAIVLSGLVGVAGLLSRRPVWQRWSLSLGRAGLVFWITYIPLSMWAAQTNWNGLFLAEPRWRVAFVFALGGLILQLGLAIIAKPIWAAALNPVFASLLLWTLVGTEAVMHPPSPILQSDATRIQLYFLGLLGLTVFAMWQVTRWWYARAIQTSIASQT
jgi:hypothetical protein